MKKTQVMVEFCLFGDEFPKDYLTDTLEIKPTETYKMGEAIKRNRTSTKTIYRKETAWILSMDYQESLDIEIQMDQIFRPLRNKVAIINQLKTEYKLECKIFIVIIMENGDSPGLYLDNEQIEFANRVKAEFDIDLYANPHESDFDDKKGTNPISLYFNEGAPLAPNFGALNFKSFIYSCNNILYVLFI